MCESVYVSVCAGGGGRRRRRRHPGYRIKNKNPTQRCGEQPFSILSDILQFTSRHETPIMSHLFLNCYFIQNPNAAVDISNRKQLQPSTKSCLLNTKAMPIPITNSITIPVPMPSLTKFSVHFQLSNLETAPPTKSFKQK